MYEQLLTRNLDFINIYMKTFLQNLKSSWRIEDEFFNISYNFVNNRENLRKYVGKMRIFTR